jgi:uncharacterized protein YecT (DUF1311 family)
MKKVAKRFTNSKINLRPLPTVADIITNTSELQSLAHILKKPADSGAQLRLLVPIRVIACIEGTLKAATAYLINHGDPYRANAKKLFQQIKVDFDSLTVLLDGRFSLGEFIADSLGWHDLTEVNARVTAILGHDFFDLLETIKDRYAVKMIGKDATPIIDSLPRVLSDLRDALEYRNELCHESRGNYAQISEEDAYRFIESGKKFTSAVGHLVSELLEPDAPRNQAEMLQFEANKIQIIEEQLNEELAMLSQKLDDDDRILLSSSQDAWLEYRRLFSKLEANAAKGGSLSSLLYEKSFKYMTRMRLLEIRECLRQDGLAGKPKRGSRWPIM